MDEKYVFLGADELLHCSVCKEAVEAFYPRSSILEMCTPLKVDGASRREAIANGNVQTMRKIRNI